MDPVEVVREGYNAIGEPYMADRRADTEDVQLLWELEERLPEGAAVLDLGCGAGLPVAKRLSGKFTIVGVDISQTQIELARKNVPEASFRCLNVLDEELGTEAYDGACSYYAIIHMPRDRHKDLLAKIYTALKPGGWALLCLGAQDLPDWTEEYYGTPMFWSHFDASWYLNALPECGFRVERNWIVADASCPEAGHLFALIQK